MKTLSNEIKQLSSSCSDLFSEVCTFLKIDKLVKFINKLL